MHQTAVLGDASSSEQFSLLPQAPMTQCWCQRHSGQQQLLVLYLYPPFLGTTLLGQGTSQLPGSRFLQEKAVSKG